jgi:hypothetical protein
MMPVDNFVGPYLPPGDLSLAALADAKKGAEGAFAATLATSGIKLKAATGKSAGLTMRLALKQCTHWTDAYAVMLAVHDSSNVCVYCKRHAAVVSDIETGSQKVQEHEATTCVARQRESKRCIKELLWLTP